MALSGSAGAQENAPEVVRPLIEEADRHRSAGRVDEAIARYREVLRLAPHLPQIHLNIGVLYHGQGKLPEAREAFTAGLERAPDDPLLLYNAAAVELQLGRPAEALAIADRGLTKHRDDASIRMIRASALRRLDRAAEALEEFQQVVRLDSRNASAYLSLGNLQHQFDRKKEAVESYRHAIRHDRSLVSAHYNLGAVLYELGQDDEALRAYEVALAPVEKDLAAGKTVDPATAQAFMNLGAIHTRKQDLPRALDAYSKAARLRADLPAAHYNVGSILYRLGRQDDAYVAYTRATELDPKLPLAHFHIGLIELRRGKDDAALERLERALPALQGSERQTARLTTAHLLMRKKDAAAAEARYREVLTDDPNEVTALVALGRLLRERNAIAEARTLLDRARRAAPANMAAALETAALARMSGDDAAERAIYSDVLKRDPERADLWPLQVNLVGLLVREGAF
ncbi:MAG TPA: tetratricopeptide repeat protein, partial [Burkholderiales bacterium]|nr:tetratricopeptide repeat protein [Burkholderiales bacterium]